MKTFDVSPPLLRWRLLLGEPAEVTCGPLSPEGREADVALEWLYGRDSGRARRGERDAGLGASTLSTPEWINTIHTLFPKEVIERLERDAVERYGIDEVVTNLAVLERLEPSESLLRAVLHTKHLMNPEVLAAARKLVAEVVRRLVEQCARVVRHAFSGTRDRRRRSRLKIARNFDVRRTIATNLHRYDPARRRLYLEEPLFNSRTQRHVVPWDIILLVDQSGSMIDSVIHSAIMASCLWQLPGMRTTLLAFDTNVVDLTADVADPVELLMKVQLGGGTDIAHAVAHAQRRVSHPRRTIVVLISDFCEGGSEQELVRRVKTLVEDGVSVLGLAALDARAEPSYHRELAARLVQQGAQVAAMTPGQLATWLAEKLRA